MLAGAAIPQSCWYKSNKYNCGLSVGCVFQGARPMDLCNGGMIWSCCVPRDRVDAIETDLGVVEDVSKSKDLFPLSGDRGRACHCVVE
ncbi:hypothetical protein HAZT_HAZT003717 [Hyalella azteca]|uniref:Uncharacterized protein n=1 Tax=Hyalella azteca TaxID=294128 RepID=A0A6A0H2X7_HYAAZ|nr:hypothetical protein HAZT_HAZT003717 [Hyalella azteca]